MFHTASRMSLILNHPVVSSGLTALSSYANLSISKATDCTRLSHCFNDARMFEARGTSCSRCNTALLYDDIAIGRLTFTSEAFLRFIGSFDGNLERGSKTSSRILL